MSEDHRQLVSELARLKRICLSLKQTGLTLLGKMECVECNLEPGEGYVECGGCNDLWQSVDYHYGILCTQIDQMIAAAVLAVEDHD